MLTKPTPLIRSTPFSSACLHRDNHSAVLCDWPRQADRHTDHGFVRVLALPDCQIIAQGSQEGAGGANWRWDRGDALLQLVQSLRRGRDLAGWEMRFCVIEFDSGRVARVRVQSGGADR
jgi:hypothetical protein